jgi:hypothetical protein
MIEIKNDGIGDLVEPGSVSDLSRAFFAVLDRWEEFVDVRPSHFLKSRYSWERIGLLTDQVYLQLITS